MSLCLAAAFSVGARTEVNRTTDRSGLSSIPPSDQHPKLVTLRVKLTHLFAAQNHPPPGFIFGIRFWCLGKPLRWVAG